MNTSGKDDIKIYVDFDRPWPYLRMQYPCFSKRPHNVYDKIFSAPEAQALMLELSSSNRLPPSRLKEISNQTNINYKTLETWRRKLKINQNYTPEHGNKGQPRKLTKEGEDKIFEILYDRFLKNNS